MYFITIYTTLPKNEIFFNENIFLIVKDRVPLIGGSEKDYERSVDTKCFNISLIIIYLWLVCRIQDLHGSFCFSFVVDNAIWSDNHVIQHRLGAL